jgi:hypothetical protein
VDVIGNVVCVGKKIEKAGWKQSGIAISFMALGICGFKGLVNHSSKGKRSMVAMLSSIELKV